MIAVIGLQVTSTHSQDLPEADTNLDLNYYQQLAEYYQLYGHNNV